MSDSYWVRHRSLRGFVGPLAKGVLHGAVAAGSLPADCEVRLAVPGAGAEKLDDSGWSKAYELLGLPAPKPEPAAAGPASAGSDADGPCRRLRERSQYRKVRTVVKVLAIVQAIVLVILGLTPSVMAMMFGGSGDAKIPYRLNAWLALPTMVEQLAILWVVYQGFQMLADIADCALRRETDAAAQRLADGR
ncbi:MAG: hypothetical protein JNL08_18620 [Planctomycetes bacterium]|nr:hypothetical protein [Planctomycetota bacterium]